MNNKLFRITTISISLNTLLKGQFKYIYGNGRNSVGIPSFASELYVRSEETIRVVPRDVTRAVSPLKEIKSLYHFYKLYKKEIPVIAQYRSRKGGIIAMLGGKLAHITRLLHTEAGLPLMEATCTYLSRYKCRARKKILGAIGNYGSGHS